MTRYFSVLAAAAMLAGSASPAAAARPLMPVEKWVLDYAETQCIAYRNYGSSAKPVTLALRASPNGATYELLVARRSSAPQLAEELKGSVDFGSGPIKAWVLHYGTPGKKLDIYQYRITAAEMGQARGARTALFHAESAADEAFTLESIPELLTGIERCTANLKEYWNLGGEVDGRIATPAKSANDLRAVFSSDDYPAEALSRHQQGTAQYLLLVNEQGAVAGCEVERASGVPVLDVMGCNVIQKRVKYRPALDRAGKPARSVIVTPPVSWVLP